MTDLAMVFFILTGASFVISIMSYIAYRKHAYTAKERIALIFGNIPWVVSLLAAIALTFNNQGVAVIILISGFMVINLAIFILAEEFSSVFSRIQRNSKNWKFLYILLADKTALQIRTLLLFITCIITLIYIATRAS